MKVQFSIRYKFLLVMVGLLGASTLTYLFLAIQIFKNDKSDFVFESHKQQISNLGREIDGKISKWSDQFQLFAVSSLNPTTASWSDDFFRRDTDVLWVGVFEKNNMQAMRNYTAVNGNADNYQKLLLQKISKTKDFWQKSEPSYFVLQPDVKKMNSNEKNKSNNILAFVRPMTISTAKARELIVVGFFSLDSLQTQVEENKLGSVSAWTKEGLSFWKNESINKDNPILRAAFKNDQGTVSVMKYAVNGEKRLGAYAWALQGHLLLLTETPESVAFSAIQSLIEGSILFCSMVLTFAFMVAIMLSRSILQPLLILMNRMKMISQGDLSSPLILTTKDETGVLATCLNQMVFDLRVSRDQLEKMNLELENKVKDRTKQLEEKNRAVREAQEALLRTTRLASAGEIAGRVAHEVLNPLTSLLTRMGLVEKKINNKMLPTLNVLGDIEQVWKQNYQEGGFERLIADWQKPSQLHNNMNLWDEDFKNIDDVRNDLAKEIKGLEEDVHFVTKEGQRINKIVNSMRKLSSVNSEKKKCSLHDLLKECSQIMSDLFEQNNFVIELDLQAEQDWVQIDKDEVIQAVTNMMRNSYQALRSRSVEKMNQAGYLVLRTRQEENIIYLTFEDNGPGIATEYHSQLFEKHFTTKSSEEGTGLGLSISRRFLRSQGGDIRFVSSTINEKTIFEMSFPLSKNDKQNKNNKNKIGAVA